MGAEEGLEVWEEGAGRRFTVSMQEAAALENCKGRRGTDLRTLCNDQSSCWDKAGVGHCICL